MRRLHGLLYNISFMGLLAILLCQISSAKERVLIPSSVFYLFMLGVAVKLLFDYSNNNIGHAQHPIFDQQQLMQEGPHNHKEYLLGSLATLALMFTLLLTDSSEHVTIPKLVELFGGVASVYFAAKEAYILDHVVPQQQQNGM